MIRISLLLTALTMFIGSHVYTQQCGFNGGEIAIGIKNSTGNPAYITVKLSALPLNYEANNLGYVWEDKEAGKHVITLQAIDLPSGMYLYRLEGNGQQIGRKMFLIK